MFCFCQVYSADATENASFKSARPPESKQQLPSFQVKSTAGASGSGGVDRSAGDGGSCSGSYAIQEEL